MVVLHRPLALVLHQVHTFWVVLLKQVATTAALLLLEFLIHDTNVCDGVLGSQMVWRLPALKLFTRRSR